MVFNTGTPTPSKLDVLLYMASIFVSQLGNLPTKYTKVFRKLSDATQKILQELLDKRKGDLGREQVDKRFKSVIDLLSALFFPYSVPVKRGFCFCNFGS